LVLIFSKSPVWVVSVIEKDVTLEDEDIPNKHSLKLFESLRHSKKLWTFKDAGHNTLPLAQELPWWQEVMQFVSGQNGGSP
jgi:hypothetical protein